MTSANSLALAKYYAELEDRVSVEFVPEYGQLVTPNGNVDSPVHRWFHLKEAYSHRFVPTILKDLGYTAISRLRVADPFAGAGTTLISIADLVQNGDLSDAVAYGIERNPFLHLVAHAKLSALQQPPRRYMKFAKSIADAALKSRADPPEVPSLSTFHRPEYFDLVDIQQLLRVRAAIEKSEQAGADQVPVLMAKLCVGATVEAISNLRRDGRTLRYVDKASRPAPIEGFLAKAKQMDDDLPSRPVPIQGRIILGDGRQFDGIDRRFRPFDLIVYSPPYPNNIDYTEVYKIENWLLGFIRDGVGFVDQRLLTVYSHPSILRPDPLPDPALSVRENRKIGDVIAPLIAAVPDDHYQDGRLRMIRGYAVDMFKALQHARRRLKPNGRLVYVAGNSVHGRAPREFVIAADLLIAELAREVGFEVERLAVARDLWRRVRTGSYLRESVVVLRR